MSRILLVTSSIFGDQSKSRQVALDVVQALRGGDPGAQLVTRDTGAIPHFSGGLVSALGAPAEKRDPEQIQAVAFADGLIAEVEAADTIVIAAPMYNFAIPSTLKAWLDHIARSGRTFRYTSSGPEGLLKGKKVFVVVSRGGFYGEGPAKHMDFQEPYLRTMLGFLGLTDVTFIHAEGLAVSAEAAAQGMRKAHLAVTELFSLRSAA